MIVIGENGNIGLWPAEGSDLQWWFDLPWSDDFVRPHREISKALHWYEKTREAPAKRAGPDGSASSPAAKAAQRRPGRSHPMRLPPQ
jgi:hypothetical protein